MPLRMRHLRSRRGYIGGYDEAKDVSANDKLLAHHETWATLSGKPGGGSTRLNRWVGGWGPVRDRTDRVFSERVALRGGEGPFQGGEQAYHGGGF